MKGISKRFPGVIALDDVGLEVYEAETVALIGENGAGKSTLMKILGGVIEKDTGSVRVDGQEVLIRSPREASLYAIEFIHQELSVLDNLDVGATIFLRDGRNVGSLERGEIKRESMVRMMVGRDLQDFFIRAEGVRGSNGEWFSVRNLRTLKYPQHAISLNVGRGEVMGLAGLVGAGRSELARAVFGVDKSLESDINLAGHRLNIRSPQDAIKEGIYLVPEDRRSSGLVVDFNVRENISLPGLERYATAKLINSAKEAAIAKEMCRKINIKTPSPEMRAANLSGGNQQKVVLAKWLALSPKVLIFDEPTRGIDVGAKAEIYSLIRNLAAEGVSLLVISSEMEEVLGISDRIAVMHEGKITGILSRPEFSEEAVMRLATGAKVRVEEIAN